MNTHVRSSIYDFHVDDERMIVNPQKCQELSASIKKAWCESSSVGDIYRSHPTVLLLMSPGMRFPTI